MTASEESKPAKKSLGSKLQRIALYFFIAVSVVLFIWLIVGGMISDSRHSEALQEQKLEASRVLDLRTRSLLEALSASMLPGIAEALVTNDQVMLRNQVQSFSSHGNLHLVSVADANGAVQATTDSRLAGSQLPRTLQLVAASASGMIVDTTGPDRYRVLAPVTARGARLGTAILEFDFSSE